MKKIKTETDRVLEQLVAERREEVMRLQSAQSDQLRDVESNGQDRLAELADSLPQDIADVLKNQEKSHEELSTKARERDAAFGAKMAASSSAERSTTLHPGSGTGSLGAINAAALGWYTPYYGTLHGSDGSIYWQGYNPGSIDASVVANGGGSGLFGTGAGSFTVYMDWWFTYRPTENRNYSHTVSVPFNGFYIVRADDGFWDSKEAHARIDLSAVGYQYNYKATGSANVFDLSNDNINVNDRFDGWRTLYYSDLLGADQAYLRVTTSLYVYARGGGSTATLNFSDGAANYLGVPWV
ncbi:hypothetical protein IV498_15825, partial [Paenarthrobacter sp. Z7-10]|uniref:hypothetical protein n=1 Tax=Paenarthrobacter sp. Z7-10 TaxID=2787635 RepID=UPI0022A8E093